MTGPYRFIKAFKKDPQKKQWQLTYPLDPARNSAIIMNEHSFIIISSLEFEVNQ
jgi:hypothetical protein